MEHWVNLEDPVTFVVHQKVIIGTGKILDLGPCTQLPWWLFYLFYPVKDYGMASKAQISAIII